MPRLLTFSDETTWIAGAVDAIIAAIAEAARRGQNRFDASLAGGTTPAPIYAAVAASPAVAGLAARVALHFWVGDEREVPADSLERNGSTIAMALDATNAVVPFSRGDRAAFTLHRWPEGDRVLACTLYAEELRATLGPEPVFDLAILGMGVDGHTAGLFTMAQVKTSELSGVLTLSTQAPSPPTARMTMGATLLRRSRSVVVLARGVAKAGTLRAVISGGPFPAAVVSGKDATFYYLGI